MGFRPAPKWPEQLLPCFLLRNFSCVQPSRPIARVATDFNTIGGNLPPIGNHSVRHKKAEAAIQRLPLHPAKLD
jgi:hypothetical protein